MLPHYRKAMEKRAYQSSASSSAPAPNAGFTLVELMVTIAVLAIVLAIAIPSFQDFLRRNRVAAEANNIVSAFAYARSEAVKRAQRITVCGVADPEEATPPCAADSWASGWIVFIDTGTEGDSTGDTILRVHQPNTADVPDIDAPDNFSTYLSYLANGTAVGEDGAPASDDVFTLCIDAVGRDIKVGTTGRVSLEEGECS